MNEKLGRESAFACTAQLNGGEAIYEPGMSKRFYAACAAMQGALANKGYNHYNKEQIAEVAYNYADELLKQENNGS